MSTPVPLQPFTKNVKNELDSKELRQKAPKYQSKHSDDFSATAGFVQDVGVNRKAVQQTEGK